MPNHIYENNDIFLTTQQAAKILNVSLSTLKKFIYQGKIKTLKTPGGHHRIRKGDLFIMANLGLDSIPPAALTHKVLWEVSRGLVNALEQRQDFCQGHAQAVAKISLEIAKGLNFSNRRNDDLHTASLLHDIGMISVSENILNKPYPLTSKEYSVIKTHPLQGEKIVQTIKPFKELSIIIRQHHERFDGKGYPDGLKKDKICQEAKIVALAEAFTCMTAKDSYKNPLSQKEALREIEKNAGKQFDPKVVEVFLKMYKR